MDKSAFGDDARTRTEVRDGMAIDWEVPIEMDDGLVLRADVYRPVDGQPAPVILSYGPYAKWLHFADGYPYQWQNWCALSRKWYGFESSDLAQTSQGL